jgi:uncharacterized membrane protein YeiB
MKKKRIIGIDVARALAVIGMIIVNFKVVFGETGDSWLKPFANFFYGKAAAVFVVLAGVGLALMTNTAFKTQNPEKLKRGRTRILKRAIFLFVVGLSYSWIWPADILHFYGIYMLLTLFFINRPTKQILIGTAALILIFPILIVFFDYEQGWIFEIFHYTDFWTFEGFFRNLFFNGFHPVIPWAAFMLFGLWYGRQNLYDEQFLKKSLRISLIAFISIQLLSVGLISLIPANNSPDNEFLRYIVATDPMPPLPFYMLNGISVSIVVISACILIANRFENNWLIIALNRTGQLALTFYVAHVVIGMGIFYDEDPAKFGNYSIEFSVIYALIFSLLCIVFAVIWLKYKKSGPLEWVMRKLTN